MVGILEELDRFQPQRFQAGQQFGQPRQSQAGGQARQSQLGQARQFVPFLESEDARTQQPVAQLGFGKNISNLLSTSIGAKDRGSEELLTALRTTRQSLAEITPLDRLVSVLQPRGFGVPGKVIRGIASAFQSNALQRAKGELAILSPGIARHKAGGSRIPEVEVKAIHEALTLGGGNTPTIVSQLLGGIENELIDSRSKDARLVANLVQQGHLPQAEGEVLHRDLLDPVENLPEIQDPSFAKQALRSGGQALSGALLVGGVASGVAGAGSLVRTAFTNFGKRAAADAAGKFAQQGVAAAAARAATARAAAGRGAAVGAGAAEAAGAAGAAEVNIGGGRFVSSLSKSAPIEPASFSGLGTVARSSGTNLLNDLTETGFVKDHVNLKTLARIGVIDAGLKTLGVPDEAMMKQPFSTIFDRRVPEGIIKDNEGEIERLQSARSDFGVSVRHILDSPFSQNITQNAYDRFNKTTDLFMKGDPRGDEFPDKIINAPSDHILVNFLNKMNFDEQGRKELGQLLQQFEDKGLPSEVQAGQETQAIRSFKNIVNEIIEQNPEFSVGTAEKVIRTMTGGNRTDPSSFAGSPALQGVRGQFRKITSGTVERQNPELHQTTEAMRAEFNRRELKKVIRGPGVTLKVMRDLVRSPAMHKVVGDMFVHAGLTKEDARTFLNSMSEMGSLHDEKLSLLQAVKNDPGSFSLSTEKFLRQKFKNASRLIPSGRARYLDRLSDNPKIRQELYRKLFELDDPSKESEVSGEEGEVFEGDEQFDEGEASPQQDPLFDNQGV